MHTLGRKSFVEFVVAILATTCLGFAVGGSHKSSERGTNITFIKMTKFNNGSTLPAGTYRMEIPENSQTPAVTFLQDGKVMATVEAKVVAQQKKYEDTEVESVARGGANLVTEIRPAGWDKELVFGSASQ